ncbi:hypothetical protein TRIATDRAFT_302906 [Trichoderma atroviride IMI 206040]|uniref:Uncharacterized protein n=1 Tax=Hypocrea atroviridis (strain ATCC 20476 / IMI 206040) TaxID=452589 RepID=G9PCE5_HYPAI|nr:uncharacterized protein TRIATDRAFT_302906 [Trichoderma atroviride IMI 206040]EHK39519.1 hypothetical protein TRIATDRAFT_302906 [Trichoderma atroviride IMI 206040]
MAWSAPEATRPVPGSGALDQSDGRYGWMIFCSINIMPLLLYGYYPIVDAVDD